MLFRLALVTVLVGVVAGCDLRPPPKGGPGSGGMVDPSTEGSAAGSAVPSMQVTPVGAPVGTTDGGIAVVPVVPAVTLDAAVPVVDAAPVVLPVSAECSAVCTKIAGVMIDQTTDPMQKAALEQDRLKLVRRMAEACTRDQWTDAQMKCFMSAKTPEALQACSAGLKAP